MSKQISEFERDMAHLDGEIKRLEAEYNMFFAGRLPRLPWETRKRVETLVKKHDRAGFKNTAERFRFGTLQMRFQKFLELWERHILLQEQGKLRPGQLGAKPASSTAVPVAGAQKEEKPEPAGDRVLHVASLRNPDEEPERVKAIYEQLSEARKQAGEQPIEYDRVKALVKAQVKQLGGGDQEVAFRIALKDGKVALTVKAVEEDEEE